MNTIINDAKRIGLIVVVATMGATSGCKHDSAEPKVYDASRDYLLPYEHGQDRFLIQGYNGPFSHSGYELDFVMPVGSLVLAARSGIVVSVVDSESARCPFSKDCQNNYVLIDHLDGTWGEYLHIQQDGACVAIGESVEQGDAIALSGNVGISLLPHLHFAVTPDPEAAPAFADVNSAGDGIPLHGIYYMSANRLKTNYCDDLM